MHKCNNLYFIVEMLTTHDSPAVIDAEARYCLKNVIFAPVRALPVGILP